MVLPKRMMIVEDEVITQRYLREILEHLGIEVTCTFDSAEGVVEALGIQECDMILMDININGGMDGIRLTKKILEHYSLPVVFISAYSDEETLDEVLELSPYGFITKPFSSKDISITLNVAYNRFLKDTVQAKDVAQPKRTRINHRFFFDMESASLYDESQPVALNVKQKKLLKILVKALDHTVSYEVLTAEIWGEEKRVADSALRTLVYSIRKISPDLPLYSYSKKGYYLSSSV